MANILVHNRNPILYNDDLSAGPSSCMLNMSIPMSNRDLLTSPPSLDKKLLRSVHNQTIPNVEDDDSYLTNLSLRHIDLTVPTVLPAIIHQCGTRTNYVQCLDISYSITNETTLKELCSYLPHLECLIAVHCRLSEIIGDTQWPKGLKRINLSRNMLTCVPSGLSGLLELTELNLSGNAITELDSELLQLPRLQKFHLLNNPVRNVPKSVCREGVFGLRTFFNVDPLCLPPTDSLRETPSLHLSASNPDQCLDLRRYVLHKQGSVESGYESSRQRALSESTCCSVSSISDKDMAATFGVESLPEGYSEAGRSQLCHVYLPDGCTEDVQIQIVQDLSLHPKVRPTELLITPVVRITPHGITFPEDKPAIIVLTHCTKPNHCGSLKLAPLCSSTRIDQSPRWSPVTQSKRSEIFQNCVIFSTTHFSLFAVIASVPYPCTSLPVTPNVGGLLEIPDLPGFKIAIPANSISSPNIIRATVYFADEPYAINNPERASASSCVGIEPHGLQFESPVTISIPIPDYVEIKESFPDASLHLYHAPSNGYEQEHPDWQLAENQNSLIAQENGTVTATFSTTHFSFYEFLWTVKDTLSLGASNIYRQLFSRAHFVSIRCQAFMSPSLSDLTFGMVVCVYKFGNPLTEISNYPWPVADSGDKQTFLRVGDLHVSLEGCFTARTDLGESLNRNTTIIDFRGEDFCTRFEFALTMNTEVRLPLTAGQVLGKLRFTQFNANSPVCTDYNLTTVSWLDVTIDKVMTTYQSYIMWFNAVCSLCC